LRYGPDTIPIVVPVLADPVALGLIASDARPGGNVTGIAPYVKGLPAKQLELAHEIVPRATSEPIEVRKATLASVLRLCRAGLQFNQHLDPGDIVFRHACKMGLEGIVSKRLGSRYVSGRSRDWLKLKNPDAPAVKREFEEDWGKTGRNTGRRSRARSELRQGARVIEKSKP